MSIFWRMRASLSLSPMACTAAYSGERRARRPARSAPPAGLHLDVLAHSLAEIGGAEGDDLEALRAALVASPCTGRDAHHVPLLELDDLVVDLHTPAPAHDHVHLLLLLVRVAEREAVAGRGALVAQSGLLELERLPREAGLHIRCAPEPGRGVLDVLLEVPARVGHGRSSTTRNPRRASQQARR